MGRYWLTSLLIAVVFCFAGASVSGQEARKARAKARSRTGPSLKVTAGLTGTYDDNILQYSPRDLDYFRRNLQRSRFAIQTRDDFISSPSLGLKVDLVRKRTFGTRVELGYEDNLYAVNSIKNYQRFSAGLRQVLWKNTVVRTSYSQIPRFYVRHLWNDDVLSPYQSYPRYQAAEFKRHLISTELERDLTRRLSFTLGYDREVKDYNPSFQARDIRGDIWSVEGEYQVTRVVSGRLGYTWEWAKARGYDGDDPSLAVSDDPDISYRARSPEARVALRWSKAKRIPLDLWLSYRYEGKEFTTGKPHDAYHYGRKDREHQWSFHATYSINSSVELDLDYDRQSRSTASAQPIADGIGEATEFRNNRYYLGLQFNAQ